MKPIEIFGTNIGLGLKARREVGINESFLNTFELATNLLIQTLKQGGTIYIAGNGGSAADAQHMAAELVGRYQVDRRALPAQSLTTDTSILTAIANDYSYEETFSRQLEAKAGATDVFVAISTSGNSKNIIRALNHCIKSGIPSILLTGNDGGKANGLATHSLIVPSKKTSVIQNIHQEIYHSFCEAIEQEYK